MEKRRHILPLLFLCAFLPACLTVEQNITLRLDGSAQIKISYEIPEFLARNKNSKEEIKKMYGLNVPLSEDEMRSFFAGIPGVALENVSSSNQKGIHKLEAVISCRNIDGLMHGPFSYRINDLGGVKVFRISFTMPPQPEPVKPPKSKGHLPPSKVFEHIMAGSERSLAIKVTTTFPTRVLSSNGNISGRTVTWVAPLFPVPKKEASGAVFEARFRAFPSLWEKIQAWLGISP